MCAIIPIRQYQRFLYNYDANKGKSGLVIGDYFFRFQLITILAIPFSLTWYWLNKIDEIEPSSFINNRPKLVIFLNMCISGFVFVILGYWLYNLGINGS